MRVIKPNNYTPEEMLLSHIGTAIAHPARKRILLEVLENNRLTLVDFSRMLNLSRATVADHLKFLAKANLIKYNYEIHFQEIEIVPEGFDELIRFLRSLKLDIFRSNH